MVTSSFSWISKRESCSLHPALRSLCGDQKALSLTHSVWVGVAHTHRVQKRQRHISVGVREYHRWCKSSHFQQISFWWQHHWHLFDTGVKLVFFFHEVAPSIYLATCWSNLLGCFLPKWENIAIFLFQARCHPENWKYFTNLWCVGVNWPLLQIQFDNLPNLSHQPIPLKARGFSITKIANFQVDLQSWGIPQTWNDFDTWCMIQCN